MKGGEHIINVDSFQVEEIQEFLNAFSGSDHLNVSFTDIMENLAGGNLTGILQSYTEVLKELLFSELAANRTLLIQMMILAVIGAVFSGFSGIFGSGQVGETGFYVIYLLIMSFLTIGFFASIRVTVEVTDQLLGFMQVLFPAYFLAVTAAGGALTSASICGFTIGAIGLVQTILSEILIPLIRIFLLLVMAGNLMKEDTLSKLTELLSQGIVWVMKTLFGGIVGFQVIQGMILPQADAVKNASLLRLAQAIPGIGGGAGAVSQLVMGAGVMIKNTAGAAAVVVLLLLTAIPVLKLCILTGLYYLAAAVMQPVCDKRLVSCMTGAAVGHELLLKLVVYSLAMFILTIAIICISTNAVWYVG